MKKIFVLFLALLICISLSACNSYLNQNIEINKTLSKLLVALEKNNETAVMDLFAPDLKSSMGEELNVQINEMMEYFEGKIISYEKIGAVGGAETFENGVVVYSVGNGTSRNIKTTETEYKLAITMVFVNDKRESQEGIWRIWVGKSDDDYMIIGSTNYD